MPNFNSSAFGDWIQIAASVGVIVGIALLILYVAYTPQLSESERTNQAFKAALEPPRVHLGENSVEVTKERQSELRYFVEKNCPACHGMQVAGSLGPALSKANLQHLSVNAVTFTILYGRPAKGMPPWEAELSEKEAYWIAEFLKRGDVI